MFIESYDNSKQYKIDQSGDLFWNIFYYAQNSILYLYPQFFQWFQKKVLTGLNIGNRIIFASYSAKDKMTGYMILKNTQKEQKICTLQILPEYRHLGYGRKLLNIALNTLKHPIITVSEGQLEVYKNLLSEYNFQLVEKVYNLYADGQHEFIFQRDLC